MKITYNKKLLITKEMMNTLLNFAELEIEMNFKDGTSKCSSIKLTLDDIDIEGFERVQWTKFDPNNSDTFPPFGHYLCVYNDSEEVSVAYRSDRCNDEIVASLPHGIEYWRPLPKHPKETEVEQ